MSNTDTMAVEAKREIFRLPHFISSQEYLDQLSGLKERGYKIEEVSFSGKNVYLEDCSEVTFSSNKVGLSSNREDEIKRKLYILTKGDSSFIVRISIYILNGTKRLECYVSNTANRREQFLQEMGNLLSSSFLDDRQPESEFENRVFNRPHFSFGCVIDQYNKSGISFLKFEKAEPGEFTDFLPNQEGLH